MDTDNKMNGRLLVVIAPVLYGTTSIAAAFINKSLMNTYQFDFPVVIMVLRMVLNILVLNILSRLQIIELKSFSITRGKSFVLPSLFYGLNSVLGLKALSHMNVAMFGVVKQCIPLVTMILSVAVLHKQLPSRTTIFAVLLLTSGCVTAGYGDTEFDHAAYLYGALCNVTQSMYLLLVQKYISDDVSALDVLQLNSYNTLPFLLVYSGLNNEIINVIQFNNWSLTQVFILSSAVFVGSLFNFAVFFCTEVTSALTTSVIGVMKTVIQTLIGSFTFGGISKNIETYIGISMNLAGSLLYVFEKHREKILINEK